MQKKEEKFAYMKKKQLYLGGNPSFTPSFGLVLGDVPLSFLRHDQHPCPPSSSAFSLVSVQSWRIENAASICLFLPSVLCLAMSRQVSFAMISIPVLPPVRRFFLYPSNLGG